MAKGRATWLVYLVTAPSWTVTSGTIPKDAGLSLKLPVPPGAKATTQGSNGAGVKWQLTVLVPTLGLSDEPIFDVPVYG